MKQLTLAKANQEGVGLLEALVAVALSAIVILGAVYSTSKIMVSQRENNLHYIVVNELSRQMQAAPMDKKESWCNGASKPDNFTLPNATSPTDITVSCPDVSIEVKDSNSTGTGLGTPIPTKTIPEMQPMVFTVNIPTLGGDVTVTVGETL